MIRQIGAGVVSLVLVAAALLSVGPLSAPAEQPSKPARPQPAPPAIAPPHGDHRTPTSWKFSWPKGDPAKGREVFAKLECYSCHEVKVENFPAPTEQGKVGPELSAMGPLHDPDYFAEALINPSAVIEQGKGFQAPDGSSKMPSFNDSMTAQELIDLVAFLRNLKPPTGAGHGGH